MNARSRITEADLHLYLAGAFPLAKRLLMSWALAVDPELRLRLEAIRRETAAYRETEMPALHAKLFPVSARAAQPARRFASRGRFRFAFAGGFALVALLCAVPLLHPGKESAEEDFIAKGKALGVSLYVKGNVARRAESHSVQVLPTDTLQVVPVGSEPQHLALLGWDRRQGLVVLFPRGGDAAPRISSGEPPPALLPDGLEESRLICVTSVSPFRIERAEALLSGAAYRSMDKAPAARLEDGIYVQIFTIAKGMGKEGI